MITQNLGCGWCGAIGEFLANSDEEITTSLKAHHVRCMGMGADAGQTRAWIGSLKIMRQALSDMASARPPVLEACLVFEYELPRERGRRPDVVILTANSVLVLEFKESLPVRAAHIDQVAAYARDLAHYHSASHGLSFINAVAYANAASIDEYVDSTFVLSGNRLAKWLDSLQVEWKAPRTLIDTWVMADYSPLPSLISAARMLFNHESLPSIRRAQSAGMPQALALLSEIARTARERGERHLALITGVTGAGKALVGLQFVYDDHFSEGDAAKSAVFLSGAGPLSKSCNMP